MSFLIRFARQWIAGEMSGSAIASAKKKNRAGFGVIINFLGEHVKERKEAQENVEENIRLLVALEKERVNASLSIKLTQLGLLIDKGFCMSNVEKIVSSATSKCVFVWIDMENSPYTEDTIDIYLDIFKKYGNSGIAIQANLKRSENDVKRITAEGGMIRLVKGAYSEKKEIAFSRRSEVTKNFSKLMGYLFYKSAFFAIATHDEKLINEAIEANKVHKKRLEFQMLMGVREELKNWLVMKGFNVVDYIPYGKRWIPYIIRRLRERKRNILLIIRSVFDTWLVFLAGIVTIMKPCCLPLVPIIFSGSAGGLAGGFFLWIVFIVIGVMLLFNMDKLMIRLLSPYFPTTFYGL